MTPEELENHNALHDGRTRWKYTTLSVAEMHLESTLNTYGQFGWELAAMNIDQTNTGYAHKTNQLVVVLKQPYWLVQPDEDEGTNE